MNKLKEQIAYAKFVEEKSVVLDLDYAERLLLELEKYHEKETPKKPKTTMNEHNAIDELCPACNRTVASYDNYCGGCGQKIGGLRK